MKDIGSIPAAERQSAIDFAKMLSTDKQIFIDDSDGFAIASMAKTMGAVPAAERQSVIDLSKEFFTDNMIGAHPIRLIEAIALIPSAERQSVIDISKQLFTGKFRGGDKAVIINAISGAPANERQSIIHLSKQLFPNKFFIDKFFNDEFKEYDEYEILSKITHIVSLIARMPVNQREERVKRARESIEFPFHEWFRFLQRLTGILETPLDQPLPSIDSLHRYLTVPAGYAYGLHGDSETVMQVLLDYQIITDTMDEGSRRELAHELEDIPTPNLRSAVDFAKKLFTDTMRASDKVRIIERQVAADLAKQLFTDNMQAPHKEDIITRVQYVQVDQREARVQRVLREIDLPNTNINFLIRVVQILETPLDQPIPPLNAGMRGVAVQGGYAYGINVHHGERESDSRKAMTLFIEHQKGIPVTEFDKAYDDFMHALDNMKDKEEQLKIKQTLGLVETEKRGFGGLLKGKISSYGLSAMDPKEFLGRIWYFASHYIDPKLSPDDVQKDQENAKASMLSALAEGIETDDHVVCNPGKIQRLIAGVLQGRLRGVNVDGACIRASKEDSVQKEATLSEQDKSTLDGMIYEKRLDELASHVRKRMVEAFATKQAIDTTKAQAYIDERLDAIAMLKTMLPHELDHEDLDTTIALFLSKHEDILNDKLLREFFNRIMEEAFA